MSKGIRIDGTVQRQAASTLFLVMGSCTFGSRRRRLRPVAHSPLIHPFQPLPIPSLHELPLPLLLGVLEVTPVAELYEVTRLVHFSLEATDDGLNGLAIVAVHLHHVQGGY